MKVHVTSLGFEDSVVLYGDEKAAVETFANAYPATLAVAPTSLVSSSCAGLVFLLTPQSAPETLALHALLLITPDVE